MKRLLRRAAVRTFGTLMPDRAATWFEKVLLTPRPAPAVDAPKPETTGQFMRLPYGPGWLAVGAWGHGPTVLLVHGWGGRMSTLMAFVDPLVRSGHRVVAFDLPAHGHSDGRRTNLIDCGGAVLSVGRGFGPLAGIVTHSFGGPAAVFAMRHGLAADRLAMVGPPLSIRDLSRPVGDWLGLPPRVTESMFDRLAQRLRFEWDEIQTDRAVGRLETPLLVVHDEEDPVVPWSHGAAVARAARVGRMMTTTGLGHRELLLDAAVITEVTEFVSHRTAAGAESVAGRRIA